MSCDHLSFCRIQDTELARARCRELEGEGLEQKAGSQETLRLQEANRPKNGSATCKAEDSLIL